MWFGYELEHFELFVSVNPLLVRFLSYNSSVPPLILLSCKAFFSSSSQLFRIIQRTRLLTDTRFHLQYRKIEIVFSCIVKCSAKSHGHLSSLAAVGFLSLATLYLCSVAKVDWCREVVQSLARILFWNTTYSGSYVIVNCSRNHISKHLYVRGYTEFSEGISLNTNLFFTLFTNTHYNPTVQLKLHSAFRPSSFITSSVVLSNSSVFNYPLYSFNSCQSRDFTFSLVRINTHICHLFSSILVTCSFHIKCLVRN